MYAFCASAAGLSRGTIRSTQSRNWEEIKTHSCRKLLVDLRETTSIGSLGIGLLVGLYTSVTKNVEGRFVLAGANPRVREVLSLTRLDTVISQAPDLDSGLSLLRGESSPARNAMRNG